MGKWKDSSIVEKANVCLAVTAILTLGIVGWQTYQDRDLTKRDLRAYLTALSPVLSDSITATMIRAEFTIQNGGRTPAYEVQDTIRFELVNRRDLELIVDPSQYPTSTIKQVIGPSVPITRAMTPNLGTPQNYLNKTPVDDRLFFWGKTTYKDIYGESHWITYCYEYVLLHNKFFAYKKFNDADKAF
jgi:hypothetical protein